MLRIIISLFFISFTALAAPRIEKVVSPQGIEAWLIEDHNNPLIAVEILFKAAGGKNDPLDKEGLARMTASLLDEGAGPYTSETFSEKLEDLAVRLSFSAQKDNLVVSFASLKENYHQSFDLLKLALTNPLFEEKAVTRVRSQLLASLAREEQEPNAVAMRAWMAEFFASHPYSRSANGTIAGIKNIQRQDLVGFAKQNLSRNVIIGVAGDINPKELAEILDSTFGDLPKASEKERLVPQSQGQGFNKKISKDIPQSVAVFGASGLKRNDPDWYAAYTLNYIFGGGGFVSRLMMEVREKRGLAYSVYSYLQPYREAGIIIGGVATEHSRIKESLEIINKEWARLYAEGVSEEELANAKTYLTGSFALGFDTLPKLAGLLSAIQQDDLGIDFLERRNAYIEALSKTDLDRVARRLFNPEKMAIITVGRD